MSSQAKTFAEHLHSIMDDQFSILLSEFLSELTNKNSTLYRKLTESAKQCRENVTLSDEIYVKTSLIAKFLNRNLKYCIQFEKATGFTIVVTKDSGKITCKY